MQKNSKFIQGVFTPLHPEKYKGKTPICYRSSLELKAFRLIDRNKKIVSWGSESVIIPYISPLDNQVHRYFVDLNITMLLDGKYEKYLIEIKPAAQIMPPTPSKRKKPHTILYENVMYSVNTAKWAAAHEWCKKHNYKFLIFTENHVL